MKSKVIVFILALAVASWTQTGTQTTASIPQQNAAPAAKAKFACCDKMAADSSNGQKSCQRHPGAGNGTKNMASCCGSKDAKSCMKATTGSASSCCGDGCPNQATAKCCDNLTESCDKDCCARTKTVARK